MVLMWWLERDSNPRPFGQKVTNLPMSHRAPQEKDVANKRVIQQVKEEIPPLWDAPNSVTVFFMVFFFSVF